MKNKKCPCRKHCWDYRDSNCDNCDIGKCVSGLHKKLDKYKTENLKLKAENEKLKAQKYYLHSDGRIEMIPTVESVRADTVREMHFEIQQRCIKTGIYPLFVGYTVDQVAYEITGDDYFKPRYTVDVAKRREDIEKSPVDCRRAFKDE